MPSKSKAQHNLMAMVAHDPAAAKRLGIPQKVGKEFVKADTGQKFARGGEMKESKAMEMRHVAAMKKAGVPKKIVKEEMAEAASMKRGGGVKASGMGKVKTAAPSRDGIATKGKTKGTIVKMCGGGMAKKK